MTTRQINVNDFDFPVSISSIKTFRTAKDARSAATSIGWLGCHILRIKKRFETVYIVGQWFMEGETICGFNFDAFLVPLFEYGDNHGIKYMKTIKAVAKTARSAHYTEEV